MGTARGWTWILGCVVLLAGTAAAEEKKVAQDKYDDQLQRYLEAARAQARADARGSSYAWINGLAADLRARNVNDLVTIRVIESISAVGSADSNLTKQSNASGSLPSLFGLETKLPSIIDPSNLASTKSESAFQGSGTTTRAGELSATVTGRVAEVLPNGDLLVESVREIEINGDRQVVVLTGIARVADVSPQNVVLSTSLGQLRIRYFGRGLMKDSLSPGWLLRILNKVF